MKKVVLIVVTVSALIITTYVADKATRVRLENSPKPGKLPADKPAPDISVKDLDGKDITLAQYRGKVILVNFWATWCAPCRVEIPELIELQQKYESMGFTLLGVAMDEEGKGIVAPFLAKERFDVKGVQLAMNYPVVIGNDDAANKFGGLIGYPASFLISRDGKLVKHVVGPINYDEISQAIESLLR